MLNPTPLPLSKGRGLGPVPHQPPTDSPPLSLIYVLLRHMMDWHNLYFVYILAKLDRWLRPRRMWDGKGTGESQGPTLHPDSGSLSGHTLQPCGLTLDPSCYRGPAAPSQTVEAMKAPPST